MKSKHRQHRSEQKRVLNPDAEALASVVNLHRQGKLTEAIIQCDALLRTFPNWPQAWHMKGVMHSGSGQHESAIDCLRQAVARDSDYHPGRIDLGRVLNDLGRYEEAAELLQQVVAVQPDQVHALNNLGIALKHLNRTAEAVVVLKQALRLKPDYVPARLNLGYAHLNADQPEDAVAAFHAVLSLHPKHIEAMRVLARLYRRLSRTAETRDIYQRWLQADPDSAVARHMCFALSGDSTPERASDDYVRQEFDPFAVTFDRQLDRLGYRAPELVAAEIGRLFPNANRSLEILDAGCGTGRAGPLFRPYCRKLVGVDLSSGMLAMAREAEIYDELWESEIGAFLQQTPARFDVITLVDTLIYFGDLRVVSAGVARQLRVGGRFLFTVELLSDDAMPYRLTATGRYSHSRDYVETTLRQAGFASLSCTEIVLRTELNEPVVGLFWHGQKTP